MHVKSIILITLMLASLALARGITSRVEVEDNDSNNNNNNNSEEEEKETTESKEESVPESVIPLPTSNTKDCAPAANVQTDRTPASTDQMRLPNIRSMFDRMDENKRMSLGLRSNLDRIRNEIMSRASSHSNSGIWQILDGLNLMRPGENRESLTSIIPNIIEPIFMPPQMQYVDNTLRLMAIRNTMDELLAKYFPNLHMIQHPTEQIQKSN